MLADWQPWRLLLDRCSLDIKLRTHTLSLACLLLRLIMHQALSMTWYFRNKLLYSIELLSLHFQQLLINDALIQFNLIWVQCIQTLYTAFSVILSLNWLYEKTNITASFFKTIFYDTVWWSLTKIHLFKWI